MFSQKSLTTKGHDMTATPRRDAVPARRTLRHGDGIGWEEVTIYRKAFTMRFVLDAGKLRKLLDTVMDTATVDAHGVFYSLPASIFHALLYMLYMICMWIGV